MKSALAIVLLLGLTALCIYLAPAPEPVHMLVVPYR